jgi:hypothetical protein
MAGGLSLRGLSERQLLHLQAHLDTLQARITEEETRRAHLARYPSKHWPPVPGFHFTQRGEVVKARARG